MPFGHFDIQGIELTLQFRNGGPIRFGLQGIDNLRFDTFDFLFESFHSSLLIFFEMLFMDSGDISVAVPFDYLFNASDRIFEMLFTYLGDISVLIPINGFFNADRRIDAGCLRSRSQYSKLTHALGLPAAGLEPAR